MKTRISIITLLFFTINLPAQYSINGYKEIKRVLDKNDTIHVVLTGDSKFDDALLYSMNNFWQIIPWDTITIKSKKDIINNKLNQLFLMVNFEKIDEKETENMINNKRASMGNFQMEYALVRKENMINFFNSYNHPMVYDVLDFHGYEKDYRNIYYRMPLIVYNIQNVIKIATNEDLKINFFARDLNEKLRALYNENAGVLKEKTLLINSDTKTVDEEDFKKQYPYKVEFANTLEIEKYIKEKNSNYCFLHMATHEHKYVTIYDLETYVPVYSEIYKMIMTANLKPKHIKDIVEAIDKSNATTVKYNYLDNKGLSEKLPE